MRCLKTSLAKAYRAYCINHSRDALIEGGAFSVDEDPPYSDKALVYSVMKLQTHCIFALSAEQIGYALQRWHSLSHDMHIMLTCARVASSQSCQKPFLFTLHWACYSDGRFYCMSKGRTMLKALRNLRHKLTIHRKKTPIELRNNGEVRGVTKVGGYHDRHYRFNRPNLLSFLIDQVGLDLMVSPTAVERWELYIKLTLLSDHWELVYQEATCP